MPWSAGLIYGAGAWELDLGRRELRRHGVSVPIGNRTLEIMAALVESGGQLVTKGDLMARVWPGAVVEENTLQAHISAIRKALGDDRRMLRTASGRGYRLLEAWSIRESGPDEVAGRSAESGQRDIGNLPLPDAALVGRGAVLRRLLDLLSAYRVVTLTGPGGIGKTRLAIEAAHGLASQFPDGRCIVELAPLADQGLVGAAVARVLGLEWSGDDTAISRAVGDRRLLLVLDTCEHVIDAAARLAEAIVRRCPNASVLATSREVLRIGGEAVLRVPPLDTPAADLADADGVTGHGAVQLFLGRLAALGADPDPDAGDLAAIAAICRCIDGIPLAIEFAAARAATLGIPEVVRRLDDRFALLTGGRRTALPRHQTLRATLDWSYDLLTGFERLLLARLAVFAGGFTLEAAAMVMPEPGAGADVVDAIAGLAAKSLVVLDRTGAVSRWTMLDTVRAYAQEKLAEAGETEAVRRRHAAFYRDLFSSETLWQRPGLDVMACYAAEIDNARAALDWCFSPGGDAFVGAVLTAAYAPVWLRLSLVLECRDRAAQALRSLDRASRRDAGLGARLEIVLAATLLHSGGADPAAAAILEGALATVESLGDADAQLQALWAMWSYRHNVDHAVGKALAERFASVAGNSGDPADELVGLRLVGTGLHHAGDQPAARRCLEQVLERYVAPSGQRHAMWFHHDQRVLARAVLARVLWLQGFLDQAQSMMRETFEAARSSGSRLSLAFVLGEAVCPISTALGDLATAERSVAMFVDLTTRYGLAMWHPLASCLDAALRIRKGDFAAGSAALRDALDAAGAKGIMIRKPDFLGILAGGLAGCGQHDEALAMADEALASAERTGQRWFAPEIRRIRGEILVAGGHPAAEAEACFVGAMETAGTQDAWFWRLRAGVSLARLLVRENRLAEARRLLAATCSAFPQGHGAADMADATRLLATTA